MSAIGKYRHRVTLTHPSAPVMAPDGGYLDTAIPLDPPVWDCEIAEATARDLEHAAGGGAIVATATHVLRGRYHAGLTVLVRVAFAGRTFEVASVEDRGARGIESVVLCREVLPRPAAATRAAGR